MNAGDLVGGKYRLTERLGAGAMGAVWAAINERTGRRVALKLILHPTDDLRERLRREALACGSLQHRNIVDVYDVGDTADGDPFLVMELLSGETLAERLSRRRRLLPGAAARIGRDIASALGAAHEAKIVHRDLKPANIFLSREGRAPGDDAFVLKVLDFGVSKDLSKGDSRVTAPGMLVGSPAYMSPEQIRMSRDVDHRTDIWSLGIILFEMLAGGRPFQGTAEQIIRQVLVDPIPPLASRVRHVPEGLDAIVARCLSRDRDKRYPDTRELERTLAAYAEESEDAATTVPLRRREAQEARAASPTRTQLLSPTEEIPSPLPSWRLEMREALAAPAPPSALVTARKPVEVPAHVVPIKAPVRRRRLGLYVTAGAGASTIAALIAALMIGRAPAAPAETVTPTPSLPPAEPPETAAPTSMPVIPESVSTAVADHPLPVVVPSGRGARPAMSSAPKPSATAVERRLPPCGKFIKKNCLPEG